MFNAMFLEASEVWTPFYGREFAWEHYIGMFWPADFIQGLENTESFCFVVIRLSTSCWLARASREMLTYWAVYLAMVLTYFAKSFP